MTPTGPDMSVQDVLAAAPPVRTRTRGAGADPGPERWPPAGASRSWTTTRRVRKPCTTCRW